MTKVVITFGTFDVFHVGHLRILERAKTFGDFLCVGISSDSFSYEKKGRFPVYPEAERMEIVAALKCVGHVFFEESLEKKADYIKAVGASVLVMGMDWSGAFDHLADVCDVRYLDRTPSVSTTEIIEKIKN